MTADRELKEGWRWVRFGDVVREVRASTKDPEADGLSRVVGLEHLDSESLPLHRWNDLADLGDGTSFTRVFRRGQVLFGKRRAYQRKVAVADFDGICSSDILVFEPLANDLLPEFLPHLARSEGFFDHALGTSAGSLSPRTKFKELAKYAFALPPVDEQRRIVDALTSVWHVRENYMRTVDCAAAALDAIRRELLAEDRTGEHRPLGEVIELAMGRVYPSGDYGESGVPLLRPGNIAPTGHLEWAPSATVRLPERYTTDGSVVMLSPGDVVMNLTAQSMEDGFLGRVCLANEGDESIVNQRIGRIRSSLLPNEYVFRVLQDQGFRRYVERIAKGSKIKHLYWQDLAQFKIPFPSEARAREVVEGTRVAEGVVAAAVQATKSASAAAATLAESLMAGDI